MGECNRERTKHRVKVCEREKEREIVNECVRERENASERERRSVPCSSSD